MIQNEKGSEFMKKNVRLTLMALGVSTNVFMGGTIAFADYDPATNTDTLTNQMVSSTRGNTAVGDFKSYNYPERNLVINWTNDSRGDGAAIRDAEVNAKNITVNANFAGNEWTDKGIISSDNETHIKASGDISITANNDAVYTENNGKTTIEGFKNLTIASTTGYGLVDNGGGITVTGGEGSTVTIDNTKVPKDFLTKPAIGNSLYTVWDYKLGKGISVKADTISVKPAVTAVFAGVGKEGTKFTVNLDAKNVDLQGQVSGMGGDVTINSHTDGTVKISAAEGDSIAVSMSRGSDGSGSGLTINEHAKGQVQIKGQIEAGGDGSSVLANMTGDGSYVTTVKDDERFSKDAILSRDKGNVELNISGNNSYIRGDMQAQYKGNITVNATGDGFSMSRSYQSDSPYSDTLLKAESEGTAKITVTGKQGKIEGNINAVSKGKVQMDLSGDDLQFTGDLKNAWAPDDSNSTEDNASVLANFSGKNAVMTGDIKAHTSQSTITAVFSGENSQFNGNVSASGDAISRGVANSSRWTTTIYEGNTVNLTLSGANSSQTGDLKAEGENTLNAVYSGTGSSLTGNANNSGTMNLTFTNQSSMTGDMTNGKKVYKDAYHQPLKTVEGMLKADFDQASTWKGNLSSTVGSVDISLKGGSLWTGNLDAQAENGATRVSLDRSSIWTGAAEGNGDISLSANSLWQLTGDSEAGSVNPDSSSTVSLEGTASRLETESLGGTGGQFLMDLQYGNDDVNAYRGGNDSDFVIARGGNGSTYNVSMTASSSVNGMKDGSKLYFASTVADSSSFKMDQAVQIQNYKKIYNKNLVVKKETDTVNPDFAGYDDWFLTPDSSSGTNGNTVNPNGTVPGSAYNAAFALWRDDDTLLKRLGELRYAQEDQGIWARFINKRLERDGKHAFHGNYKTLQIGFDKEQKTLHDGNWYYGGAISHLWGDSTYMDGRGEQKSTDVAIYGTNVRLHGHYLDLVARVGRIDSDYETSYSDRGEFKNWVSSISAEYGRKKALRHGWAIEPQAQMTYNYLWGDDYTTRNGAKVQQDNADSLVGRLGFVLSREFHPETKNPSRVYFKASVLHDFLGNTQSHIMDDVTFTDRDDLGDTWYLLGIGTNIHFSDTTQFYLDAERSFHSDIKMKYRFNAGLRFEF